MTQRHSFIILLAVCIFLLGCRGKTVAKETQVTRPEEMKQKAGDLLRTLLQEDSDSSLALRQPVFVKNYYQQSGYLPAWSASERWQPAADSLYDFIRQSRYYGLFPEDYHQEELQSIRQRFAADSLAKSDRADALLWARSDILFTDAWAQLIHDVKLGRLPDDSISLNRDSTIEESVYREKMSALLQQGSPRVLIDSLEPSQRGYQLLKSGIKKFLDSAEFREYTVVPVPGKDSLGFKKALQKRLFEGGYIAFDSVLADSAQLARAVKKFQQAKGITVDGKAGAGTVRMLNLGDREKFIRIAISMDKYKKLPAEMPEKYIWVNTSSNYLEVMEDGKVKFSSRVISGKPLTRTPLLNGAVSLLITYPQWVPPPSIVAKEILPAVKKNPGYLARKGFSLLDNEGEEVDPYTVDWSKYNKSIPYRVVQGSGDANALGVLKFHFDNKYSVYLHDTNQRYLFANAMRSLSHGCVRVQEWMQLALYILRNDSLHSEGNYTRIDSLKTWLKNKEKRQLGLRHKMPLFIRYFTCEGRDGGVVFFDDVYGDDRRLREKYFTNK